jgi:hypothetical protein
MNTLREELARRAEEAGPPALDLDTLVATGERRLRRRRAAAVVGGAAAVAVTVVLAIVATSLTGTERHSEPVHRPQQEEPARVVVRKIVYADLGADPGPSGTLARTDGRYIHYGNRKVDTGRTYVNMDVTDDGFAWTTDRGQVWFSDGRTVDRIGSHPCTRYSGGFVTFDPAAVVAGNAGSLLAWFDCTNPKRPALVVYDTGSSRAGGQPKHLTRERVPGCGVRPSGPNAFCDLVGIVGDHVYWDRAVYSGAGARNRYMRRDITTGQTERSSHRAYQLDLRSAPRALVVGDSYASGTVTDGVDQAYDYPVSPPFMELSFVASGRKLVAFVDRPNTPTGPQRQAVFANATRDRVQLRLPHGYRSTDTFTLFQWLDDDTVALGAGANTWGGETKRDGDILRCTLSTGRCVLAVPGGRDVRIVPHLLLPG